MAEEKCPKCGAAKVIGGYDPRYHVVYECGSWDVINPDLKDTHYQKDKCRIRELEAELQQVKHDSAVLLRKGPSDVPRG